MENVAPKPNEPFHPTEACPQSRWASAAGFFDLCSLSQSAFPPFCLNTRLDSHQRSGGGGEHLCRSVYVRASVVNPVIYTSITLPGILGGSMYGFNYHTPTKHRLAALPSSKHRSLCICFSHYLDVRVSVMISDSGHMIHQEDVCSADM